MPLYPPALPVTEIADALTSELTVTKVLFPDGLGGVEWDTPPAGFTNPMTTQDDIIVGGVAGAAGRLAKGSDGQVLTVDPTTHHLLWATSSAGFSNPMTTKGDLIVGDTGGSPIRKAVGTNGYVLTADSASTGGMKWDTGGGGGGASAAVSAIANLLAYQNLR